MSAALEAFKKSNPSLLVGTRVKDADNYTATVLYIGPVASASNQDDIYCGLEWDDVTRGKHDGSVISKFTNKPVRHFQCRSNSATAGSFAKPKSLTILPAVAAPPAAAPPPPTSAPPPPPPPSVVAAAAAASSVIAISEITPVASAAAMHTFRATYPTCLVGCRVKDIEGCLATVRYIGPVATASNQDDIYCGLEWDDPTRGKHDGTVISKLTNKPVRHFRCVSNAPTAASFAKPKSLVVVPAVVAVAPAPAPAAAAPAPVLPPFRPAAPAPVLPPPSSSSSSSSGGVSNGVHAPPPAAPPPPPSRFASASVSSAPAPAPAPAPPPPPSSLPPPPPSSSSFLSSSKASEEEEYATATARATTNTQVYSSDVRFAFPRPVANLSSMLATSHVDALVAGWLADDVPSGVDLAALAVGDGVMTAKLWMKDCGVLAGVPFFDAVFKNLGCAVVWSGNAPAEGFYVGSGNSADDWGSVDPRNYPLHLADVTGPVSQILRGERTALCALSRCSGVATGSANIVRVARSAGWKGTIAGTRKTTPGFRLPEKYGLIVGGAATHRMDLSQMVMLKDNHIAACGGDISMAVRAAKVGAGFTSKIEVECSSFEEGNEAGRSGADICMLDNYQPALLKADARRLKARYPHMIIEASGGITAQNILEYVSDDVDVVSIGKLTQGYKCLDFSLKIGR